MEKEAGRRGQSPAGWVDHHYKLDYIAMSVYPDDFLKYLLFKAPVVSEGSE